MRELTLDICSKAAPVRSDTEPALVTLTSGWPSGSVAGVEERRLEGCHLLLWAVLALGVPT